MSSLKGLRIKRGLTQQQLADKVSGLDRSDLSRYERGAKPISNMTLGMALKLCDALHVANPRKLLDPPNGAGSKESSAG